MSLVLYIDAEYGNVDLVNNNSIAISTPPIIDSCKCKVFVNDSNKNVNNTFINNVSYKTIEFAFNWNNSVSPLSGIVRTNGAGGASDQAVQLAINDTLITLLGFSNPTIYINYNESNNIIAGKWYHIVITADENICNGLLLLFTYQYFRGYAPYVKLYDHSLSLQEIEIVYKQWLNKKTIMKPVYLKYIENPSIDGVFKSLPSMIMDFSNYGADGINKSAFKGMLASGNFTITRENNRNVLNRITSVYLSIPYYKIKSRFEFEVFKPLLAGDTNILLCDTVFLSPNRYGIGLTTNNVFSFYKRINNALTTIYTGTTQYSLTEWIKIRCDVDSNMRFSIYVNNNLEYQGIDTSIPKMNYITFQAASTGSKWADLRAHETIT